MRTSPLDRPITDTVGPQWSMNTLSPARWTWRHALGLEFLVDVEPVGVEVRARDQFDVRERAALERRPVDPVDASAAMVRHAVAEHALAARVATFDELDAKVAYDGVWANFSLLHAERASLPEHLARARAALRAGGALYASFKVGEGERRDALGRRYTYVGEAELNAMLETAGFRVEATFGGESRGLDGVRARWTGRLAVVAAPAP